MMENVRKRGEVLAGEQLARARSEIKAALADELPGDVRIVESPVGIELEAPRLQQRLSEHGGLRDIGFLMRGVR
jgi:hypothetical protein